jgi:hypothetical protein
VDGKTMKIEKGDKDQFLLVLKQAYFSR